MEVVGWDNMEKLTGLRKTILDRFMRLYKFPKPERIGRMNVQRWDSRDVIAWMYLNKELVDLALARAKVRKKFIGPDMVSPRN